MDPGKVSPNLNLWFWEDCGLVLALENLGKKEKKVQGWRSKSYQRVEPSLEGLVKSRQQKSRTKQTRPPWDRWTQPINGHDSPRVVASANVRTVRGGWLAKTYPDIAHFDSV